ncbi:hypothetical protein AKO1_012740 [Acrasis kona]|uniref:Uncharacterized protein n=1 Tax=Acrasis kona TaxID=1008807 RepID=A0AAW2YW77_9EUKA
MNKDLWFVEINRACGEAIDAEIKNDPSIALQKYAHCIELVGRAIKGGLKQTNATPKEINNLFNVASQCLERSKVLLSTNTSVPNHLSADDIRKRKSTRTDGNGIRQQFERIISELDDGITSLQMKDDVTASEQKDDRRKSLAAKMLDAVTSSDPWEAFIHKNFTYPSDKIRRDLQWAREISTAKDSKAHIYKYLKFICDNGGVHPLSRLIDLFNIHFSQTHIISEGVSFYNPKACYEDIKGFVACLFDKVLLNHWVGMGSYRKEVISCLYALVLRRVFPSIIKVMDVQQFNYKCNMLVRIMNEQNMTLQDLDVRDYMQDASVYQYTINTLSMISNPMLTIEEYADRLGEAFVQTICAVEECCEKSNVDPSTVQLEVNEVLAVSLYITLKSNIPHFASIMDLIFEFISVGEISRDARYAIMMIRNSLQWGLTFDLSMEQQEYHDEQQQQDQQQTHVVPTAQPILDFSQPLHQVEPEPLVSHVSPMIEYHQHQLTQDEDFLDFLDGHMGNDWTTKPPPPTQSYAPPIQNKQYASPPPQHVDQLAARMSMLLKK